MKTAILSCHVCLPLMVPKTSINVVVFISETLSLSLHFFFFFVKEIQFLRLLLKYWSRHVKVFPHHVISRWKKGGGGGGEEGGADSFLKVIETSVYKRCNANVGNIAMLDSASEGSPCAVLLMIRVLL